ncbi:hypothetical protein [Variovorax sp. PCZ-1]|uniref:hypothetical protein n=1 Tax=Variovorax sp. PCZ-1 TaxID=2835533 RepID=UPI001BD1ACE2|nr:hypothetical protein [Variovorax sp. PCZ-1]MBS7807712.1 hypothetical protein [Variovorax sp. PCZ-1]
MSNSFSPEISRQSPAWMWIIWPSFLCACVLEMLIFAVVSPAELAITHAPHNLSVRAVYSISFFVIWALTFTSSALTAWLSIWKKESD